MTINLTKKRLHGTTIYRAADDRSGDLVRHLMYGEEPVFIEIFWEYFQVVASAHNWCIKVVDITDNSQ